MNTVVPVEFSGQNDKEINCQLDNLFCREGREGTKEHKYWFNRMGMIKNGITFVWKINLIV
jgi:hypothetical protein